VDVITLSSNSSQSPTPKRICIDHVNSSRYIVQKHSPMNNSGAPTDEIMWDIGDSILQDGYTCTKKQS
jgi:hypothetical protein